MLKQQFSQKPRDPSHRFDSSGELCLEPEWLTVSETKDKSTRRGQVAERTEKSRLPVEDSDVARAVLRP